jgi:hypothetical protein
LIGKGLLAISGVGKIQNHSPPGGTIDGIESVSWLFHDSGTFSFDRIC